MLRYDFQNGIVKRGAWLLLPVTVFTLTAFLLASTASFVISTTGSITLGDCLLFYFQGSIPVNSNLGASWPALSWLLIQTGCLLFTLEYPTRDLSVFGHQILVRCKSRIRWWLSKCLWLAESVLVYLLVGLGVTAAASMALGAQMSLAIRQSSAVNIMNFCNVGFGEYSPLFSALLLIVMPYLSMLAFCLMCMLINLLLDQILSLLIGIFILVVPSQLMLPVIITNYTMLQRSSLFYEDGLDFMLGMVYSLAAAAIAVILGALVILRIDIIEPKKNGDE